MAKVKTNFSSNKRTFKKWQSLMQSRLGKFLQNEIVNESILKGKSPVKPGRRYQTYSDSYKRQIKTRFTFKRISPVNLKLTGKLLDSFTTSTRGNKLRISFTDKKAVYHDEGTNKIPQRKMLPSRRGERFARLIERNVQRLAEKVYNLVRRR
jgi:hypothetical protein